MNNRLRTIASQVGPRLVKEGNFNASAPREAELPPPVSHQKLSRMINMIRSALFPEFLNTGDATWHVVSQTGDASPILDEIGAILLEQMKVAARIETAENVRVDLRRATAAACSVPKDLAPHKRADDEDSNRDALKPLPNEHLFRSRDEAVVAEFFERLPKLQVLLNSDIDAILEKDVATSSRGEVVLSYPSVYCMTHQRIAHELHLIGVSNLITRTITEIAHTLTGIDIHPHTSIGHHFFIDHGTGVVIGGTAIIGNNVSIYQGVTLGAKSFPTDEFGRRIKNQPRHPIIQDNVTLYSSCCVLGRVTVGKNSTIGGNVFVTRDVPPFSVVAQKRATVRQVQDTNKQLFQQDQEGGAGI